MAKLYKSVISYNFGGSLMQNVLYFQGNNPAKTAEDLTLELAGNIPSIYGGMLCNQAEITGYYAQRVDTLSEDSHLRGVTVPTFGFAGSGGPPLTSAVVVSLRTGFYGRSARGRAYVGAYYVGWITGGKLNAAGVSNVQSRWGILHDRYKNGGSVADWTYGVYSKKVGGYTIPYDVVGFLPYTHFQLSQDLGTERGRKS